MLGAIIRARQTLNQDQQLWVKATSAPNAARSLRAASATLAPRKRKQHLAKTASNQAGFAIANPATPALTSVLEDQLQQATALAVELWFQPQNQAFWFASTAEFDAQLTRSFGKLLEELAEQSNNHPAISLWPSNPEQRLGLILLCDQFPRNCYRGEASAYELDGLALATAKIGVMAGEDTKLNTDARCFFYLPFEHSENLVDQHTCVGLLTQLRDAATGKDRERAGNYLRHAHQHRDIIQRFGRFPHRNRVLERTSSIAEAEFANGGSFGQ